MALDLVHAEAFGYMGREVAAFGHLGRTVWVKPNRNVPPIALTAPNITPAVATIGEPVTIIPGTYSNGDVTGILMNGSADVSATLTPVATGLLTYTETATSAAGTVTQMATAVAVPSLSSASALYIDSAAAPAGPVASLTTRGTWAAAFAEIAVANGATAIMEADGLRLNGNNMRSQGALGTFRKLKLMFDLTLAGTPLESTGNLITINPGNAAQRLWARVRSTGVVQVLGPSGGGGNHALIAGFGQRQVIGCELDSIAGSLTLIDADGLSHVYPQPKTAITITEIQMGRALLAKVHRLALIVEE